jgi:NAD(P)-dependent dehydrogenase (short-subunit alcohol dehydrogenase family)
VALVTGASRGLGRGIALALADRGFDVVATMRDPSAGSELPGIVTGSGSLRVEALDVTALDGFEPPAGLRVLVNNAGSQVELLPLEHSPLDGWRALLETNVIGLVAVTQRAVPALRAAGGGVVCNITSASLLVPMPFYAPYRASKAAVTSATESLRAELAPQGIRVLEVLPGAIDTDMLAEDAAEQPETIADDAYRALAQLVASARSSMGDPTPVADAAAAIVDAICAEEPPLRVTCDAMGEGLLDGWNRGPNDAWMASLYAAFEVPS